ncbi:MAG TPA: hypothetical protein VJH24_04535 [Candidatus Bilamarchaeaceae archaeon]|nr:hypothetical protein [Candidatus Bilamarchaeaceae archaeon]
MKRSRGLLSTQTQKFKARTRLTPSDYIRNFPLNSTVVIVPHPSPKGQPSLRYSYRHGRIVEKRGKSYLLEVTDGNKQKRLIVHPIHLMQAIQG